MRRLVRRSTAARCSLDARRSIAASADTQEEKTKIASTGPPRRSVWFVFGAAFAMYFDASTIRSVDLIEMTAVSEVNDAKIATAPMSADDIEVAAARQRRAQAAADLLDESVALRRAKLDESSDLRLECGPVISGTGAAAQRQVEQFLLQKCNVNVGTSSGCARVMKVLFIGNTGAGKSELANMLVRNKIFEARAGVSSVTREVERAVVTVKRKGKPDHYIILYNVPGLIELNPAHREINKEKFVAALGELGSTVPSAIYYVCSAQEGRIQKHDMEGFRVTVKYLVDSGNNVTADAMNIIVNKWAYGFDNKLRSTWRQSLREISQNTKEVVFIPSISAKELVKERPNFYARQLNDAWTELANAVMKTALCMPEVAAPIKFKAGSAALLKLDEDTLKASIERLEREIERANDRSRVAALANAKKQENLTQQLTNLTNENSALRGKVNEKGCFHAATKLTVVRASQLHHPSHLEAVAASDVRPGDLVICGDSGVTSRVLFVHKYPVRTFASDGVKLTFRAVDGSHEAASIMVSSHHLVRSTTSEGRWLCDVPAREIPLGACVAMISGATAMLVHRERCVIDPPVAIITESGTVVADKVVMSCHTQHDGGSLLRGCLRLHELTTKRPVTGDAAVFAAYSYVWSRWMEPAASAVAAAVANAPSFT